MSVAGSASVALEHINGGAASAGKSWSMGNQLTFSGSGELDNGMIVSLSFIIDQGDDETDTSTQSGNAPFDSHSVSIGMDGLGTVTFHGEGGSAAMASTHGSAAGCFWVVLAPFWLMWFVLASFGFIWFVLACFGFFWLLLNSSGMML